MAKDPAMLWYWGDWNSGTCLMSRFLKGCYMDLLHAQFNHGRLSLEDIKTCLGSDFGTAWPALQKKFKQDEKNLFFNERCELEKLRRAEFVSSRSNGKSGRKKSHDKSHDFHTDNHTEDENENEVLNGIKDFGKSENLLKPKPLQTSLVGEMQAAWKEVYPDAFIDEGDPANLFEIAGKINEWQKLPGRPLDNREQILLRWGEIANHCRADSHLKKYSIQQVNKHFSSVIQSLKNGSSNEAKSKLGNKSGGFGILAEALKNAG